MDPSLQNPDPSTMKQTAPQSRNFNSKKTPLRALLLISFLAFIEIPLLRRSSTSILEATATSRLSAGVEAISTEDEELSPVIQNATFRARLPTLDLSPPEERAGTPSNSTSSYGGGTSTPVSPYPFASTTGEGFSACILTMDDNYLWPEWLAYHYQRLPLRRLIVAMDPNSKTKPTEIFDRYQRHNLPLEITLWENDEFASNELKRFLENENNTLYYRHRKRQPAFLQACLRQLHSENRTWVLLVDTDEYLVPTTPELLKRNETFYEILTDPSHETMAEALPPDQNDPQTNAAMMALSEGCFRMSRFKYIGSEAENITVSDTEHSEEVESAKNGSESATSMALVTRDFHSFYSQQNGKTMVDLSKLTKKGARETFKSKRLANYVSVHGGVTHLCGALKGRRNHRLFEIRHYGVPWERVIGGSNDSRGLEFRIGRFKRERELATSEWDHTKNPFANYWIEQLIDNLTLDKALDLLRPPTD